MAGASSLSARHEVENLRCYKQLGCVTLAHKADRLVIAALKSIARREKARSTVQLVTLATRFYQPLNLHSATPPSLLPLHMPDTGLACSRDQHNTLS